MAEIIVLCEGTTEREFCRQLLQPALAGRGVFLRATLAGDPGARRGGVRPWAVYRRELSRLLAQRPDWYVGLLVDYYAMPSCWPGRADAAGRPLTERGRSIEDALQGDLGCEVGGRLVPCVQVHEFETLLFVSPQTTADHLAVVAGDASASTIAFHLSQAVEDCGGVEAINDGPSSAPSKRLEQLVSRYDKVAWGVPAVMGAGLDVLRAGCPWLDRWMTKLEKLGEA